MPVEYMSITKWSYVNQFKIMSNLIVQLHILIWNYEFNPLDALCHILLYTTITQNVKYKQIVPNNQKSIDGMADFFNVLYS